MNYASTQIPTAEASKYILKLCRHFAHKVSADFSDQNGQIRFLQGQCVMKADAQSLSIYMQAQVEDSIRAMQFIIDDHLQRFARFETLSYQWGDAVPEVVKSELDALTLPGSTT
jgi:hypothetical protein